MEVADLEPAAPAVRDLVAEGEDADRGELLGRVPSGLLERFGWSGAAQGALAAVAVWYLGLPSAVNAGVAVALVDGQADAKPLAPADLRAVPALRRGAHHQDGTAFRERRLSVRVPFALLHDAHSVRRLPSVSGPFLDHGITWSKVRFSPVPHSVQR